MTRQCCKHHVSKSPCVKLTRIALLQLLPFCVAYTDLRMSNKELWNICQIIYTSYVLNDILYRNVQALINMPLGGRNIIMLHSRQIGIEIFPTFLEITSGTALKVGHSVCQFSVHLSTPTSARIVICIVYRILPSCRQVQLPVSIT